MLADEACTAMLTTFAGAGVGVGVGVGGPGCNGVPPPPPHPGIVSSKAKAATLRTIMNAGRCGRAFGTRSIVATSNKTQKTTTLGSSQDGPFWPLAMGAALAGRDVTFTVRMVLSVPFAGKLPLDGLKLHAIPAGRLGQLNVNASVSPFCEFNARLKLAEPPTGIVADRDEIVLLTP